MTARVHKGRGAVSTPLGRFDQRPVELDAEVAHERALEAPQTVEELARTPQARARAAFVALGETLDRHGLVNDGVIVARMARGRREFMLGGRIDPVFGPVVLVGDGGKYVEAMPDARVLVWPFGKEEVLRALGRLRVAVLFEGVRREPALDSAALATAAVALGKLLADGAAGVTSLDINPFMVGASGEGGVALDAVVYLEK